MASRFNIIAAACENNGIGKNGDLPWRLKKEMAYFTKMTSLTQDQSKQNAVLMGRLTWDSIPSKYKPLPGRLNVVISTTLKQTKHDAIICETLNQALHTLKQPPYSDNIESLWIIGGSLLYKEALNSDKCHRIYLTRIHQNFDCDVFFPNIPANFTEVRDDMVPSNVQEENNLKYEFKVYEKVN